MSDKVQLIYNEIERRIDEICDDGFVLKENQKEYETLTDLEDFIDSLPEEPASEDLEEEIKRYINEEVIVTRENVVISKHHEFHNFYVENIVDVARHFAEWQKKQMMKDAVEGYISLCHDYPHRRSLVAIEDGLVNYKYAEKIKIIICKTEQQ